MKKVCNSSYNNNSNNNCNSINTLTLWQKRSRHSSEKKHECKNVEIPSQNIYFGVSLGFVTYTYIHIPKYIDYAVDSIKKNVENSNEKYTKQQ